MSWPATNHNATGRFQSRSAIHVQWISTNRICIQSYFRHSCPQLTSDFNPFQRPINCLKSGQFFHIFNFPFGSTRSFECFWSIQTLWLCRFDAATFSLRFKLRSRSVDNEVSRECCRKSSANTFDNLARIEQWPDGRLCWLVDACSIRKHH